eukprot:TRINITY_DN21936_c1_g1_i2.p1 TRINITY_DN21936_c1_g1~~TRINITY_DN21936_c1_g1_i2.p1  ORF type:complete len:281 (+),score=5.88 TRINITY_DN21936_c1_g1_i2:337-1179(+)
MLWKLPIPPKLRLFCWRLLHDKLPKRLAKWDPAISSCCLICRGGAESLEHLFVSCSFAIMVWSLIPTSVSRPNAEKSIGYWSWHEGSTDHRRLGITLMWYLWKTRNNYIFQYIPVHPVRVKEQTILALFDWNLSHVHAGPSSASALSTDWWLAPPPRWYKLNFDAAFNADTRKAGVGGLVRDEYGTLLMAYTAENITAHPLEAELIALQRGLIHLSETQCSAVEIEGDCLSLVTTIKNSSQLSWDMMPLWRRTMHLLSEANTWTIHYCKRTANRVADLLA